MAYQGVAMESEFLGSFRQTPQQLVPRQRQSCRSDTGINVLKLVMDLHLHLGATVVTGSFGAEAQLAGQLRFPGGQVEVCVGLSVAPICDIPQWQPGQIECGAVSVAPCAGSLC